MPPSRYPHVNAARSWLKDAVPGTSPTMADAIANAGVAAVSTMISLDRDVQILCLGNFAGNIPDALGRDLAEALPRAALRSLSYIGQCTVAKRRRKRSQGVYFAMIDAMERLHAHGALNAFLVAASRENGLRVVVGDEVSDWTSFWTDFD